MWTSKIITVGFSFLTLASDNGLGTYNNVVTVTKRDFDVYFETQELASPEKGAWSVLRTVVMCVCDSSFLG